MVVEIHPPVPSQIPPLRPPPSGRKLKRENLFLRTVMDYSFHILQVSRPYIDATLCKVWASNSSWLVGYSLLYLKNVPPPKTALPNKKNVISTSLDYWAGLWSSYFVSFKSLYRCNIVQSLSSELLMVVGIHPPVTPKYPLPPDPPPLPNSQRKNYFSVLW